MEGEREGGQEEGREEGIKGKDGRGWEYHYIRNIFMNFTESILCVLIL